MSLTSVRLLGLLIGLCIVLLIIVVLARRVSPRHSVPTRVIASVTLLVLGTAAAGAGVNRHFGLYRGWADLFGVHSKYLVDVASVPALTRALAPLLPAAPHPTHGTLLQLRLPGPISGVSARNALIYLPPQYRDPTYRQRRFPVVEAFQGSPGRPSDWILGLRADAELDRGIAGGLVAPTIMVFPDTNGGLARSLECTNTADGIADETFLTQDVRSWVTTHLRTQPGRWVAAGYSTGGYCALDLAFRHPDLFSRSISLGGYAHALSDGFARGLWRSPADRLAHSPDWWINHHAPAPVDVYLLAGTRDKGAVHDTLTFWRQLDSSRWRTPRSELVTQRNGRHTFPAWEAALLPALSWALPGSHSPQRITPQQPPTPTLRSGLGAPNRCHTRPQPRCLPGRQPSPTVPAASTSQPPSTTTSTPTPTATPQNHRPVHRASTLPAPPPTPTPTPTPTTKPTPAR